MAVVCETQVKEHGSMNKTRNIVSHHFELHQNVYNLMHD